MAHPKETDAVRALDDATRKFLRDHPEAAKALELFGITNDRYQTYLAAQREPKYFTASSTLEGGPDGELD